MACLEMTSVLVILVLPCLLAVVGAETNNLPRIPVTAQQRHHHQFNQSKVVSLDGRPSLSTHDDVDGGSSSSPHSLLCVHKVIPDTFDGMTPFPDASGRVLLWQRSGVVFMVAFASDDLRLTNIILFIDISDRVWINGGVGGLISVAMDQGGRIYLSYTTVTADNCPYLVVEELLAATSADEATRADPSQARRLFSMVLTQAEAHSPSGIFHYVGQTLWTQADAASLYVATTNPTASEFEGKIVHLRVDTTTGEMPTEADLFATGFGVPRGCSFDSDMTDVLYCATIDAQLDVVYSISSGQPISVVADHERAAPADSAPSSIVGGLMYRGSADASLFGSYIYVHNSVVSAAVEAPAGSRHYTATQNTGVKCPSSSPVPCPGDTIAGTVTSFAEDGNRNAYVIATDGVYRVVAPSLCRTGTSFLERLHLPNWVIGLLGLVASVILGGVTYKITCYCCNREKRMQRIEERMQHDHRGANAA